jgi:hypothetical protein
MSKIIVTKAAFTADVNNELSSKELAEKWQLSEREIRDIAKQLNLTIKKKREKRYSIVDEVITNTSNEEIFNDQPVQESSI